MLKVSLLCWANTHYLDEAGSSLGSVHSMVPESPLEPALVISVSGCGGPGFQFFHMA